MKFKEEIKALWEKSDKNAVLGILYITLILAIYFYFGIADFFANMFPNTENLDYWKYIYHNVVPLFLFFGLGLIFVKYVLKGSLKDFGLTAGDYKLGIKLCLIFTPLFIIAGLSTVTDSGMNTMYPLARYVIDAPFQYVLLYYISYLCYYIGWEFLFRGIGMFSISKKSGVFVAITVTTMISALVHSSIAGFGKPLTETFSAIPAGIAFGYIAYKTRSIWYSFYMHVLVGFSTDFFISLFTRSGLI